MADSASFPKSQPANEISALAGASPEATPSSGELPLAKRLRKPQPPSRSGPPPLPLAATIALPPDDAAAMPRHRGAILRGMLACLVSTAVHMVAVVVLAMWITHDSPVASAPVGLIASLAGETPAPPVKILPAELPARPLEVALPHSEPLTRAGGGDTIAPAEPAREQTMRDDVPQPQALATDVFGQGHADWAQGIGNDEEPGDSGEQLEGWRSAASRQQALIDHGGTPQSEAAVARALAWLSKHQMSDGSWSFDHRQGPCKGRCGDPGLMAHARLAATAMALLPYLGAGQTHKHGEYKKTVQQGLYYLVNHARMVPAGADLSAGGTLYSQGICAIALCEAYAMTKDRNLYKPAQQSLNFIMAAQDPRGGGWRYTPQQRGDTSVVGWQLMALKSGAMGYLIVDENTIAGVTAFLDSVQKDQGAGYGYMHEADGTPATSAVGLLCRMYLGWKRDNPALERGVGRLAELGPSADDMYFNYYATQVLHQYDGELWTAWNNKLREQLIATQARGGHEDGSWQMAGPHSEPGGRLYNTSMATMTLEVYYRHLPLYTRQSTRSGF